MGFLSNFGCFYQYWFCEIFGYWRCQIVVAERGSINYSLVRPLHYVSWCEFESHQGHNEIRPRFPLSQETEAFALAQLGQSRQMILTQERVDLRNGGLELR